MARLRGHVERGAREAVARVGVELRDHLRDRPVWYGASRGGVRQLTMSLAAYPEDAFDTASLLSRAEEALDGASRIGSGSISLYGALAGADLGEPL